MSPVQHPLHMGPDFSFVDGRKPKITSFAQLQRREQQVQLGRKIVQLLKEVDEAEALLQTAEEQQRLRSEQASRWSLRRKGDQPFV